MAQKRSSKKGGTKLRRSIKTFRIAGVEPKAMKDLSADFRKFAKQYDAAAKLLDRGPLAQIVTEGYMLVDPQGKTWTKEEVLTSSFKFDDFASHEDEVRIHGNTAVSSGVFSMKGTRGTGRGQADISGKYRSTHTFVRADDGWKLVSTHLSKISKN